MQNHGPKYTAGSSGRSGICAMAAAILREPSNSSTVIVCSWRHARLDVEDLISGVVAT